jgi:hypothetical protein
MPGFGGAKNVDEEGCPFGGFRLIKHVNHCETMLELFIDLLIFSGANASVVELESLSFF